MVGIHVDGAKVVFILFLNDGLIFTRRKLVNRDGRIEEDRLKVVSCCRFYLASCSEQKLKNIL